MIPSVDVHLGLVSEQILPNLLPLLHPAARPKKAVFLVTPRMGKHAGLLSRLARETGISASFIDVPAYDVAVIRDVVLDVLSNLHGETVALNATGGTKVMAIGAYEVFRESGCPAFYIDTQNNQWIVLLQEPVNSPLPEIARVDTYLKSFGYEVLERQDVRVRPEHRELTEQLVSRLEHFYAALPALNHYASQAEKNLHCTVRNDAARLPAFLELVGLFKSCGLLDLDDDRLVFLDEHARFFVNGGWLEQFVLQEVNALKKRGQVFDRQAGVVVRSREKVKNELDIVFTAKNRLHIIECKARNLVTQGEAGAETAYKLDNIRDLMGGTFGRAMLVCFGRLREVDMKRCQENDIKVVVGQHVAGLRSHIAQWIKGLDE